MTISAADFRRFASDPSAYRDALIVDVDGVPTRLWSVIEPWQAADYAALDPGLMACNGRGSLITVISDDGTDPAEPQPPAPKMRAYIERPRGHSKTTDLAVTCCWAMAFAARPIKGYAYAADRDQAGLLKDAMATILRLNPWLGSILSVHKDWVENVADGHPGQGSRLEISTSDVKSSYGILPDFIIADEMTHWEGDGGLWESLISSAAKRQSCLLCVISNAGFLDSWQWGAREAARTDPGWHFASMDGPQASWMNERRLAEQRRHLPAAAYSRLWENVWSSGGGDALTPDDIDAAFDDSLAPMTGKEHGWLFVAGIDLGVTSDCTAVVVLAVPEGGRGGRIRMSHAKLWRPVPGSRVNLTDVEKHVLAMDERFGLEAVAFDPWQMELLAQRLETAETARNHKRRSQRRRFGSLPWLRQIPSSGANLRAQATLVIESFADRRFSLFPYSPLKRDLLKLRVEEKSYGYRLTSPRDETGHGDTASAFVLALMVAHELAGKKKVVAGGVSAGQRPLTAFDRAAAEWQARRAEYLEEDALLAGGGQDRSGRDGWGFLARN